MPSVEAQVAEWCARDRARAFLPMDRAIVESTAAPRALVIERLGVKGTERDLFHACAMLGRIIAERGGSPTLAALTIDSARDAIGALGDELVASMRAAVAEGFGAAMLEAARAEAASRWEYPRCVVPLAKGEIAIAAGYPEDDGEALAAWAARVANAASRAGARLAILSGGEAARAALTDALTLAGIQVRTSQPPPPWTAR
jgi:hypothetical protein